MLESFFLKIVERVLFFPLCYLGSVFFIKQQNQAHVVRINNFFTSINSQERVPCISLDMGLNNRLCIALSLHLTAVFAKSSFCAIQIIM